MKAPKTLAELALSRRSKNCKYMISVSPEVWEKFTTKCKKLGVSASEMVEELARQFLEA